MKFIFYIDGDNIPKQSIEGIENLAFGDEVCIFYAENNATYSKKESCNAVRNRCVCDLNFIPVQPGDNAVDFAVALHAGHMWGNGPAKDTMLFLISRDNHFEIIRRQLERTYKFNGSVKLCKSISEAWNLYFWAKICTESDWVNNLKFLVGEHNVPGVMKIMKEIFSPNLSRGEASVKTFIPDKSESKPDKTSFWSALFSGNKLRSNRGEDDENY